jgi:hypothetical protein
MRGGLRALPALRPRPTVPSCFGELTSRLVEPASVGAPAGAWIPLRGVRARGDAHWTVTGAPRFERTATSPAFATPAGFECEPNDAKLREDSSSPTENREPRSSKKRVVTLSGSKVAKLAAVAANAVRNYDLSRAIEVIEDLRRMGEGTR